MNVFKLLSAAAVLLFTVASCSNEELDGLPQEKPELETKSVVNEVELSTVAQLLASIEIDQSVMDEVKAGVDRSLKYGLDEEYRFTDMLRPESSKIQRNSNQSLLVTRMSEKLGDQSDLSKNIDVSLDFFNLLSNNDVQIYWPFSDNWDGSTLPIILCATDNSKYAYKPCFTDDGGVIMESVNTSREFLENNTVWIISKNETTYDELPDFENGEFVNKDGVFFYSKIASEWLNKMQSKSTLFGDPVHIGEITVYEGDGSGGPEIYFMWGHAGGGEIGGLPVQGMINTYRVDLTSKELNLVKQINLNIQPNWTPFQKTNALMILEKDGGKDKSTTRNLTYTNPTGMSDMTVPVNFKYERRDETLYDQIIERSKIFSSANRGSDGKYKQYHGNGIYFTLPTPGFSK